MDDGGQLAAEFGLDGDDITSIALGDEVFLCDAVGDGASEDGLDGAFEAFAHLLGLLACLGEFGAGAVEHFAAFVEVVFDAAQEGVEVGDACGDAAEQWEFASEGRELVAERAGVAEGGGDFEDVGGGQGGASRGGEEFVVDGWEVSEREVGLEAVQAQGFGGLGVSAADFFEVVGGGDVLREGAALRGVAEAREALDDFGEFEGGDGAWVEHQQEASMCSKAAV